MAREFISKYPAHFGTWKNMPTKKNIKISNTETRGQIVSSLVYRRAGETVFVFAGLGVPYVTQHSLRLSMGAHIHDPWVMGLIGHSCNPNMICDMPRLTFVALRDIQEGEELTMDYMQTETDLFKDFDCECGSDNCKGRIGNGKV